jgi:hypothetical protein
MVKTPSVSPEFRVRHVTEEEVTDAPHVDVPLLIMLLVHVSQEIERGFDPEDVLLELAPHAVVIGLNAAYLVEGAPYGDDEEGLREWLFERWPCPPTA